jgi:hypothetical protein
MTKKTFSKRLPISEEHITSMMTHMMIRHLITAGAEELQEAHGWTPEKSATWALATMARAQAAIDKALTPSVADA